MVVSGVPQENGINHAGEIASMALDLVSVCHTFKIPHKPNTQLKIRAGIHSGTVTLHDMYLYFSPLWHNNDDTIPIKLLYILVTFYLCHNIYNFAQFFKFVRVQFNKEDWQLYVCF